jgi:N-acetylmuramoyl-L-alanine amidase
MGRIFLSAGHGTVENNVAKDPGAIVAGTSEAQEMILLRDLMVAELRSRSEEVLSVPDELTLDGTIAWINSRAKTGDLALEVHTGSFDNPATRGASAFYISNNDQRKQQAEQLLLALIRRIPQLPNRGALPDTTTGLGRLSFSRDVTMPSIMIEVCYLTNPDDRGLLQTKRREFAVGLVDGLLGWSKGVAASPISAEPPYPATNIRINGSTYGEQGIVVNGNAYIPIDLVDRLNPEVAKSDKLRRIGYRGLVFIKAVELREFNVTVAWDAATRTVILQSVLRICQGSLDRIMGHGNTSELQLNLFLKARNEAALKEFPDLAKLYRDEGAREGVNYDVAFCQMCLDTKFLVLSKDRKLAETNNFANLADVTGGPEVARFDSAAKGVRAHIQHLKAYASTEPLNQDNVDPRFRFVVRGIAPLVGQLGGRWAPDVTYGDQILELLRKLYEASSIL